MKWALKTFVFSFWLLNGLAVSGQCVSVGCNSNSGLFSNDDAASIEYDNMGGGHHSTFIRLPNGQFKVWGGNMRNSGTGSVLSPQLVNQENYPALTGTVYKVSIGSRGPTEQLFILTSTGLFANGIDIVLHDYLTTGYQVQKITIAGKQDGLPPNVFPDQVKMFQATTDTLIITTCSGEVYVLSKNSGVRGNGNDGSAMQWSKVMENATTPMSNVIAARASSKAAFALKADGTLWTWGNQIFLGDGASHNKSYATQMVLPQGMPAAKMIRLYGNSYFVLGTDKKVYSLGMNSSYVLGDQTSVNRAYWVNARHPAPDLSVITDAVWISASEHDSSYPAFSVIMENGLLYSAGSNDFDMIGNPYNTLRRPLGINATDVITQVCNASHSTAVVKQGSPRYGYVGHRVDGSMGDGYDGNMSLAAFNFVLPPIINVCGTQCMQPTVTNNGPLCNGANALFSIGGTPGDTVSFMLNNGNIQTMVIGPGGTASIPIDNATSSQTLLLTAVMGAAGNCYSDLSISSTIAVGSNPVANVTFNQISPVCQGDLIIDLPNVSLEGISGIWSPALNNQQTTTYTFTPEANSCGLATHMTIVVIPKKNPVFTLPDFICHGDIAFTLASTSINNIEGLWSPEVNNTETTTYVFMPNHDQCAHPFLKTIEVVENPHFTLDVACERNDLVAEVKMERSAQLEWRFKDVVVHRGNPFNVGSFLRTQFALPPFGFEITATFENGCSQTQKWEINNVMCDIPKGISPNDDQLNDTLDLHFLQVEKLSIFNRYGLKVFEKINYENQWHGQDDNGRELPPGVYYYTVDLKNQTSKTGWIYLNK